MRRRAANVTWLASVLASAALIFGAETAGIPPGVEAEADYSFAEVIQRTTGHKVITFNPANEAHATLLVRLKEAAAQAARSARAAKIDKARANEVGNAIESHVLKALNDAGLVAQRPQTTGGRAQAAGYPDVEIASTPPCYLELKTYNARTADSTQRTFYYSPSELTKITHDAVHLLLAFEMEQRGKGDQTMWLPVRFKIVSLHDLKVRLKIEYNQSNRGLYTTERLLADELVKE